MGEGGGTGAQGTRHPRAHTNTYVETHTRHGQAALAPKVDLIGKGLRLLLELDGLRAQPLEEGKTREEVEGHGLGLVVLEGPAVEQRPLQQRPRRGQVAFLQLELPLPHPDLVPARRPQHLDIIATFAATPPSLVPGLLFKFSLTKSSSSSPPPPPVAALSLISSSLKLSRTASLALKVTLFNRHWTASFRTDPLFPLNRARAMSFQPPGVLHFLLWPSFKYQVTNSLKSTTPL